MAENEEPEEGEQHEHGNGGEVPAAQEDRIVDKVVAKVRGVFEEIVGAGGDDGGGGDSPRSAPAGPAATEADMERKVKEGVEKEITARERKSARAEAAAAHEAEHERMRGLIETPPKQLSRLTTTIWGSDDS